MIKEQIRGHVEYPARAAHTTLVALFALSPVGLAVSLLAPSLGPAAVLAATVAAGTYGLSHADWDCAVATLD